MRMDWKRKSPLGPQEFSLFFPWRVFPCHTMSQFLSPGPLKHQLVPVHRSHEPLLPEASPTSTISSAWTRCPTRGKRRFSCASGSPIVPHTHKVRKCDKSFKLFQYSVCCEVLLLQMVQFCLSIRRKEVTKQNLFWPCRISWNVSVSNTRSHEMLP